MRTKIEKIIKYYDRRKKTKDLTPLSNFGILAESSILQPK
jgi:hypothetical protein